MASASPVVTGDGVIENDTTAVNAVFHYSLPALAAPETYDWALIPHLLRPGTDFIPYQSTQTYPAGPASSGTIKIPVFPDLLPEEHGGLRLIARPSTAPTWADSMSAPVSPLEFNALNADYEVLYWQDDLVVARRSIYATQTTYLDTYERSADGTLTLRSTIQLGPNLYSAGIRVSRYAMVVFKDGQLHTWLRNPEAPFTWVKKTIQYGTATGQVFLAEDRLGLELNNEFLVYRLDPALATGWRMTGTTGFNLVILFREDFVVVPHFGASMQILERSQTTEDSWRPVYQITEAPGQWPYAVTGAEGIIAVAGVNGVEIHERLTQDGGWARTATLPVPDTGGGNEISLALAGDWLAVGRGTRFDETKPEGTVKLYLRDAVNRGIWKPAGTLQGPGPRYGLNLFWNRGELISNAHDGYTPHQVVVRKFQGGEVMVRDDDRSKLSIAVSPHPEPASGSSEAECYAELPLPAETDVLVTHDFISGTAVAGQDFTALNGSVLINKGQRRTTIPFTLLADDLVEPEEFLTIRMATAGQAAVEVSANIWNSNMPPVVIGSATPLLEGLGESTLTLRQVPVTGTSLPTGPVSVGIEVGGIENPPATLPLSTSGLDLPGMRDGRLLSAAVPAASFNVRANQDEVEEAAGEAVSAWFSLPEGLLSPGTLGLVHEGWLPALPANITGPAGIGRITAGRGWIFGLKSGTSVAGGPPQGVVACYRIADTGSPRLATPQILKLDIDPNSTCELDTDGETLAVSTVLTIHDAPWNVLRLYQRTGPVAAPWEPSLEFSRYAGYSPVGIAERVKLTDRNHLSWGSLLYERVTGSWPWRLINPARQIHPAGDLQDTNGEWLIFKSVNGQEVRAYQRTRGVLPGWILKNTFLHPGPQNFREVHLRNQTLFVQEYPGNVKIYRESANGMWELEQTLPSSVSVPRLEFLTESAVAGGGSIYTRTGPPDAPWVLSGGLPVEDSVAAFSNGNQTLLQMFEANTDTPRIRIYQAGLPLAVVDDDSLVYSIAYPNGSSYLAAESYGGETVHKMLLSANRAPPFPESVRVHSRDTGSAMAGADYAPVDFRLVCGPRASVPFVGVEFPIRVFSDRMVEGQETFELVIDPPAFGRILAPQNFILGDPQTTGRRTPTGATTLLEPPSGSMMQSVEYILQVAPDRDVTLTPSLAVGGTAVSGTDFTLTDTPLLLKAGANRVRVPVLIHGDALDEGRETIFLKMTCLEMPQSSQNLVLTIIDATVQGLAGDEGYPTTQGMLLTANGQGGAPAGVQANDPAPPAGVYLVNQPPAWGQVTMQPNGDFTAVPGPNALGVLLFSYQLETIPYHKYLNSLAPWKYLHPVNGVSPAVANPAFPSMWATAEFNDNAWRVGSGIISYGGLAAPYSPSPVNLAAPPTGARYTTYFRTTFASEKAVTLPLRIMLYCDDAAIVYINGVERGRVLDNTSAAFATAPDEYLLLSGIPGQSDADESILRTVDLPAVPLLAGSNVLAISLHNSTATSSDLGLRLESLEAGIISEPVPVRITVADANLPPVGTPDLFSCPQNSPFLSSENYGPGVLDNDGLYGPSGVFHDPVTQVIFSEVSVGTLTMIGTDGHFRYMPPPDFSGTAGFMYQIRDKDGLSAPVPVTLNVQPSLPYDLWHQQLLPGNSGGSDGDADADGRNNFLEYALVSSPVDPGLPAGSGNEMAAPTVGGVPGFSIKLRKAADLAWRIESAVSPDAAAWNPLVESRGLNYRFTHSSADSALRNNTTDSFVLDVWPRTTPAQTPRLFYRLRTERIPPQ